MRRGAIYSVVATVCASSLVLANVDAASAVPSGPCGGSSGLTIGIVNKTGKPDSRVNWFVQQKRASAPNPELVAGPFKFSEKKSIKCQPINAGQIVITLGASSVTPPSLPASDPADQPTYAQPSPDTEPKRFQTVELTIPGIVNLTAVDMFGIPVDIATSSGKKRVWKCYTDAVRASLQKSLKAAGGNYSRIVRVNPKTKQFLRFVSPNIVSGSHPSGYPKFNAYLSSLKGKKLTVKRKKGVDFSPYGYSYSGIVAANGSIVLRPTSSKATYKSVSVRAGSLTNNNGVPNQTGIYGNNSPYFIGSSKVPHYVGENDRYAAVYRDLVAGFAYGFWKKTGPNDSSKFNVDKPPGPFKGAQPRNPRNYNTWAAALWPLTQAYGFPFEDTFNPGNRNPAIPVKASGKLTLTLQPDVTPRVRKCT